MMRRLLLGLVGASTLLASLASAADGHPRAAVGVGAPVTGVALANDEGVLAASANDAGSRFPSSSPPFTANPHADTWFLYSRDGRNLIQDGDADPAECDSGALTSDDCQTHVTQIAVSANGERLAAVSVVDASTSILVLATDRQGDVHKVVIPASAQGLAMSSDGTYVALAATVPGPGGNLGRVFLYTWGATTLTSWNAQTPQGATAVSISADGAVLDVAAGTDHYRYRRSGSDTALVDHEVDGGATGVDTSASSRHISVAGTGQGRVHLYSDDTPNNSRDLRASTGLTSVRSLALRRDGSALAVGGPDGDIYVFPLDPGLVNMGNAIGHVKRTGAVTDLAFSGDGRTLAVASGGDIAQYAVGSSLTLLWSNALAGSVGKVAVEKNGDFVAAAGTDGIVVYEAVHAVTATPKSVPVPNPGATIEVVVTFRNTGNRLESVTVGASGPANWDAAASPTALDLAPDAEVDVKTTMTVPDHEEPGTQSLTLSYQRASAPGTIQTLDIDLPVPTVHKWIMGPAQSASLAIQAGGEARFVIPVGNEGNQREAAPLHLTGVTTGWEANLKEADTMVDPGETRLFTVIMKAPATARELDQGRATLDIGGLAPPILLTGTVGARFEVGIAAPFSMEVAPGQTVTAQLTIMNRGNALDGVHIKATGAPAGWSVSVAGGGLEQDVDGIEAGTSKQVAVQVGAPATATGPVQVPITFTARSQGDASQVATTQTTFFVPAPPTASTESSGEETPAPEAALLTVAIIALARRKASKGP